MSDRLSRAVRTFVQAFLATGIPLVAAKLAEVKGLSDLSGLVSGLAPVVSAALAAAISAVMFVVVPPAPKP